MPEIQISETYKANNDIAQLVSRLPAVFDNGEGELIFDERNKLRRLILRDGTVVIIKRYKRPNLFQKICYSTFWKNKAKKSFLFAEKLLAMGVETPLPIACVTYKKHGFVSEYYLVTTEAIGIESHKQMLAMDEENDEAGMLELSKEIARLLVQLHENGFLHGDSNLFNFICRRTDTGFALSVIDINRSKVLGRPATYSECIRNLRRVTHIHSVLSMISRCYARQKGWDEDKVAEDVFNELNKFERHKERSRRCKRLIGLSR